MRTRESSRARIGNWSGLLLSMVALASCAQAPSTDSTPRVTREPLSVDLWREPPTEVKKGVGFGRVIFVSGDTAMIGNSAAASLGMPISIFHSVGANWVEQVLPRALYCGEFNGPARMVWSFSFSENTALVSDSALSGHYGPCVYVQSGGDWALQQVLEAGDPDEVLSMVYRNSGDTALVQSSKGVAVFERTGTSWTPLPTLSPSDGGTNLDKFAVSGDTAIVLSAGSGYVFTRRAATWSETQTLTPNDGQGFTDVFVAGERALLSSGAGTYAFARIGETWGLEAKLTSARGPMTIRDDIALVGTAVYRRAEGSWSYWQDLTTPKKLYLSSNALWEGGALLGSNPDWYMDGFHFTDGGSVFFFDRYSEPDSCARDEECVSGHCVEGICCRTACSGACQSCRAERTTIGRYAVCGNVKAGTDPLEACPAEPVQSCGMTGVCNGAGACSRFPDGTPCETGHVCSAGACEPNCINEAECSDAGTPNSTGGSGAGGDGPSAGGSTGTGGSSGSPEASGGTTVGGGQPENSGGTSEGSGGTPESLGGSGGEGESSARTGGRNQLGAGGRVRPPRQAKSERDGGCSYRAPRRAEGNAWPALGLGLGLMVLARRRRF